MSDPRFYVPVIPSDSSVQLSSEDARHAHSVLRLRVGDRVKLFDGRGMEASAVIDSNGKSNVSVSVSRLEEVSRDLAGNLELIVSLPKGDRQKQLVDMLVQLGVHALTPLICQRSVAQPTTNAIERLQRMVIESSKQCGRNRLMRIRPAVTLGDLVAQTKHTQTALNQAASSENLSDQSIAETETAIPAGLSAADATGPLRLFAHPYGSRVSLLEMFRRPFETRISSAQIAIGPEGGFSADEVLQLVSDGWQQVYLGERILRIETAAIMVAATWAAWNDEVGS